MGELIVVPIVDEKGNIKGYKTVEELVRCKDCKHYVSDRGAIMYCEHTDVPTNTSDYCSYGERREE